MNHKSFVFFDCECANTFDGIGKICSFGYAICDDELNIIEREDVVMNPECEFDWYILKGKGKCHLAYSKDYFRTKPNFESYYKEIKKLLTTGNRYIAGFAVSNDVSFINSACKRYDKPNINFRAFDAEKYFEQKYQKKQKLTQWAEDFGVNTAKFQSHKSEDDAVMTMLCLKADCKKSNKTIEQIFTENKRFFVSAEQIFEQAEERAYRKEMTEKIKRLYNKVSPKPRFKKLAGQKFELDKELLKDTDTAFELVKKIYECGGCVCEHLTEEGTVIFADDRNNEHTKKALKRGLKTITLEKFYAQLQNKTF